MPVDTSNDNTSEFQKYCEKSIEKLSSECIERFEKASDDLTRTKLLYETARAIPVNIREKNGKCYEVAQQYKTDGNVHFAKKNYGNALETYNKGIIICPQDSGKYLSTFSFIRRMRDDFSQKVNFPTYILIS